MAYSLPHSLKRVVEPDQEPITLAEAKRHLRITTTDDDDYIEDLITACRQYFENTQNRTLTTSTWLMTLDGFPDLPNNALRFTIPPPYSIETYLARAIWLMSGPLYLQRPPVQSVTYVKYLDPSQNTQTMQVWTPGGSFTNPPGCYAIDLNSEPARLVPGYGFPWPVTLVMQGSVQVQYVAGYGDDPSDVPFTTKQALKLMISHLYENREPFSAQALTEVKDALDALLWQERVLEFPA